MVKILDIYLTKKFFSIFAMVLICVIAIFFIFDFIELSRIGSTKNVGSAIILDMTMQKIPLHVQKVIGFIVLIASITNAIILSKNHEVTAIKVVGISTTRLLLPTFVGCLAIGLIFAMLINPFAADMINKYEMNESKYFKSSHGKLTVSKNGIWLKQIEEDKYAIIHSMHVSQTSKSIQDVTFFMFSKDGLFLYRMDTTQAFYRDNSWILINAKLSHISDINKSVGNVKLPSSMTFEQIEENITPPDSISLWRLYSFIGIAKQSGLSVKRYVLHLSKLICLPISLLAMGIIGAAFAIRHSRFADNKKAILYSMSTGFVIHVISDIIFALGASGEIHILLSAITPPLLSLMAAILILIHSEHST